MFGTHGAILDSVVTPSQPLSLSASHFESAARRSDVAEPRNLCRYIGVAIVLDVAGPTDAGVEVFGRPHRGAAKTRE